MPDDDVHFENALLKIEIEVLKIKVKALGGLFSDVVENDDDRKVIEAAFRERVLSDANLYAAKVSDESPAFASQLKRALEEVLKEVAFPWSSTHAGSESPDSTPT